MKHTSTPAWRSALGLTVVLLFLAGMATALSAPAGAPVALTGREVAAPLSGPIAQATAPATSTEPASVYYPENGVTVKPDSYHDVSLPLRDIPPVPDPPGGPTLPMENPRLLRLGVMSQQVDPYVQLAPGPEAMPTPSLNFEGLANSDNGTSLVQPPDTDGDVGPNHYVQWINNKIKIWDKSGTALLGPINGSTLWSGMSNTCATLNHGDPIVLYDSIADRWLVSQFTYASPYMQCIAVSTSPDPTGSWYRYAFQMSTTVLYDYPHGGVWPDGYYFNFNRFSGGTTWAGDSAVVFERSRMLIGATASMQEFIIPSTTPYGALLPADLDGGDLPPEGAPNYWFGALEVANRVELWKFHVDWTTPVNSTFGLGTNHTPDYSLASTYTQLCSGGTCIPAPRGGTGSTRNLLDSLGDRPMWRLAYRNYNGHESMVSNFVVDAGSGRAGVRWLEVRNLSTTPTIYQQGTYAPADTLHRWMGSIAMDRAGNIALGFSSSINASGYPKIAYTGRLNGELPLGTMTQGEVVAVSSTGQQTGGPRWGDYAAMSVDPADDCTFWFTQEYLGTGNTWSQWHTRIVAFKYPSCAAPTPCFSDAAADFTNFNHTANTAANDDWAVDATTGNPAPAFKVGDPASVSDKQLVMGEAIPVGPATTGTNLVFDHRYTLGAGDGAVLEGSTDGGLTWIEIKSRIATGAYPTVIASATNPLNGRAAWTGVSGAWQKVTVNLSQQFPSQNVLIRWRFASDNATAGTGWWIDNVRVENCASDRDLLSGFLYADCNNNGTRETAFNEAGISGVTMSATGDNIAGTATTTTNAQGFWQFAVTPGTGASYSVWVEKATLPNPAPAGWPGAPARWNTASNSSRCTGAGWTSGSTTYWNWGENGGKLVLGGVEGNTPEGLATNTRNGMLANGSSPTALELSRAEVQQSEDTLGLLIAVGLVVAFIVGLMLSRRRR